jgi:hypothetical protein
VTEGKSPLEGLDSFAQIFDEEEKKIDLSQFIKHLHFEGKHHILNKAPDAKFS